MPRSPRKPTPRAPQAPADPHAALLDAAERVALRDGVGRVTLDAVAKEAGLSKSGLIHHYPSKDALIGAMVLRKIDAWAGACDASIARRRAEHAGATRGLIDACFECPEGESGAGGESDDEDSRRRGCVVIAALVHDAKHIEPVRRVHRRIDAQIARDGLPAGVADAVHLALNGLWFNWVFNLSELDAPRLERVRAVLEGLLARGQGSARKARRSAAKPRPAVSTPRSGRRASK